MHPLEIPRRPRRLRQGQAVRSLVQETSLSVTDLIAPLFVLDGNSPPQNVESLPGVQRFSIPDLVQECRHLYQLGLRAAAIFPCVQPDLKDPTGSYALHPGGLILRAVRAVKQAVPDLLLLTDVALDPYTTHGHDGILNSSSSDVDNDATVSVLSEMAVLQAKAGVDWVAPSDMMDGRVHAIRTALDHAGFDRTGIISYSTKFASAYYGPFRDAVGSRRSKDQPPIDKRTYQLNPANTREAILESLLDEAEGADLLMVKPAGLYLDIIHQIKQSTSIPLAAYQVSGEFAQLHAAAEKGWLDLSSARNESLLSIKRAGADLIITYFAKPWAQDHRST